MPLNCEHTSFCWSGKEAPFLDTPDVTRCGHVTIGRLGGMTAAGAHKNEDAALVWAASDGTWTFAALLDAHGSSESADLVLARIAEAESPVLSLLSGEAPFWELTALFTRHLGDPDFRRACANIRGETALLLCAQKGGYLWWLSVGDIPVYVFHSEFARQGQFALNQRMFFEWVGQVNTFALPVHCYTTGVRQLRAGRSRILLTTDGLLECGSRPLENGRALYDLFAPSANATVSDAVLASLNSVIAEQGRDSATLIAWEIDLPESKEILQPSA